MANQNPALPNEILVQITADAYPMTYNIGDLNNYKLMSTHKTKPLLVGPFSGTVIYRNFSDGWMFRHLFEGMSISRIVRDEILKRWKYTIYWANPWGLDSPDEITEQMEIQAKVESVLEEMIAFGEDCLAGRNWGLEALFKEDEGW